MSKTFFFLSLLKLTLAITRVIITMTVKKNALCHPTVCVKQIKLSCDAQLERGQILL